MVGLEGVIKKHYGAAFGPGCVHVLPICSIATSLLFAIVALMHDIPSLTHGQELLGARTCEMLPAFTPVELPYPKQGDPDCKRGQRRGVHCRQNVLQFVVCCV